MWSDSSILVSSLLLWSDWLFLVSPLLLWSDWSFLLSSCAEDHTLNTLEPECSSKWRKYLQLKQHFYMAYVSLTGCAVFNV